MNAATATPTIRRIEPLAGDWRSASWSNGQFDTAGRAFTPEVEGIIRTGQHVLMVTLSGGAAHLEVTADCGHRYRGTDFAGAVSFVPAGCTRHLKMRGVASKWGSVSLDPGLFSDPGTLSPFSNREDPFIAASMRMLAQQVEHEDGLDDLLGEAVGLSLVRYLEQRQGRSSTYPSRTDVRLPRWKLDRVIAFIDANLEHGLRIVDLAGIVGLSPGFFHRAFKATTGFTPLAFVQRERIRRSVELLRGSDDDIAMIALRVGFAGPSHFARTFYRLQGCNPSVFRRDNGRPSIPGERA